MSGRSPSELRRRIGRLFGEPETAPIYLPRGGAAFIVVLVLAISPIVWSLEPATMGILHCPGSKQHKVIVFDTRHGQVTI